MFYSNEKSNTTKRSVLLSRPGGKEDTTCCICGKPDGTPDLKHCKRYGGYVCSIKCLRAKIEKTKQENPPRIKILQYFNDIEIVKSKLASRRAYLKLIDNLSNQMDEIISEMESKNIFESCASYKGKWFYLNLNLISCSQYITTCINKHGKPICQEYAKEYADILFWHNHYEYEVDCVEKFLTSGKCIRYKYS